MLTVKRDIEGTIRAFTAEGSAADLSRLAAELSCVSSEQLLLPSGPGTIILLDHVMVRLRDARPLGALAVLGALARAPPNRDKLLDAMELQGEEVLNSIWGSALGRTRGRNSGGGSASAKESLGSGGGDRNGFGDFDDDDNDDDDDDDHADEKTFQPANEKTFQPTDQP